MAILLRTWAHRDRYTSVPSPISTILRSVLGLLCADRLPPSWPLDNLCSVVSTTDWVDAEDAEGLYRVELCTTDRFYWPSSLQSHRRSRRHLQARAHLRGVASGLQRAPGSASGENMLRRGRAQLGGWVLRHLSFYLGAWKCGFILHPPRSMWCPKS